MDDRKRTPQRRRKMPLKQRVARAIVQAVEGKEQKKPQRAQPKQAAPRPARPAAARPQPTQQPRPQQPRMQQSARRPLTPAQRRQRALYLKRMRRRKRLIRSAAAAVVIILTVLVLSRTVLFKIEKFEVVNPETVRYSVEEIEQKSGFVPGTKNLFTCDLDKVGKDIEGNLPYIGSAEVKRNFPDTLQVTLTPTKAGAAIILDTGYLLIDENGKMLEIVESAPDGIPVLRCKTDFIIDEGQTIGVPSGGREADEQSKAAAKMIGLYKNLLSAIRGAQIDEITLIDIRNESAITLMYQNRLTLHLGNGEKLDQKLQLGAKAIAEESDPTHSRTGAINLTNPGVAYVRDTYENSEGETHADEPQTEAAEQ